jgi:hypothetical protein
MSSAAQSSTEGAIRLGSNVDANGKSISFDDGTGLNDDSGNEQIVLHKTASAVNQVGITNAATNNPPQIAAEGGDSNIDLLLAGKGTGVVKTGSSSLAVGSNVVLAASGYVDVKEISTPADPAANTASLYVKDDGSGNTRLFFRDSAGVETPLGNELVAVIEDQKTQNTAAQTLSSASDQTRDLNTLAYNRNSPVSLSSNRFTLPAGTWRIAWWSPVHSPDSTQLGAHQSLLYNFTDSSEVARGMSGATLSNNSSGSGQQAAMSVSVSQGSAVVTIAASKAFEVRHRVQASGSGGHPANFGTEVYTRVEVWRA